MDVPSKETLKETNGETERKEADDNDSDVEAIDDMLKNCMNFILLHQEEEGRDRSKKRKGE